MSDEYQFENLPGWNNLEIFSVQLILFQSQGDMLNKDVRHDQKELKDNKDQTEVFVGHPKSFIFSKNTPMLRMCYGRLVW